MRIATLGHVQLCAECCLRLAWRGPRSDCGWSIWRTNETAPPARAIWPRCASNAPAAPWKQRGRAARDRTESTAPPPPNVSVTRRVAPCSHLAGGGGFVDHHLGNACACVFASSLRSGPCATGILCFCLWAGVGCGPKGRMVVRRASRICFNHQSIWPRVAFSNARGAPWTRRCFGGWGQILLFARLATIRSHTLSVSKAARRV